MPGKRLSFARSFRIRFWRTSSWTLRRRTAPASTARRSSPTVDTSRVFDIWRFYPKGMGGKAQGNKAQGNKAQGNKAQGTRLKAQGTIEAQSFGTWILCLE